MNLHGNPQSSYESGETSKIIEFANSVISITKTTGDIKQDWNPIIRSASL